MTIKLILIALGAAAFGWGFSAFVEHTSQTIRTDNARVACQEWSGNDCSLSFER
jgi:hypothetical protein